MPTSMYEFIAFLSFKCGGYSLLSMADVNLYTKFLVYMFSQMLGGIYAAMSSACAAE